MSSSGYTSLIVPLPSQDATHSFLDCLPIGGSSLITLPSSEATSLFGPRDNTTVVHRSTTTTTALVSSTTINYLPSHNNNNPNIDNKEGTSITSTVNSTNVLSRGSTVCMVGIRPTGTMNTNNHSSSSSSSDQPQQSFASSSSSSLGALQLSLITYDLDYRDMYEYNIRPVLSPLPIDNPFTSTIPAPTKSTSPTVSPPPIPLSSLPPSPLPDPSWIGEQIPVITKDSTDIVLIGTAAERIDNITLPLLSSSLPSMSIYIVQRTILSSSASRLAAIAATAKTVVDKNISSSTSTVSAHTTTSSSSSSPSFTIQPIHIRTSGYLPARCGAAMCLLRKTRIVVFGGISRQSIIQQYTQQYPKYKPKVLEESNFYLSSSSSAVEDTPVYLNDFGYITWTNTTNGGGSSNSATAGSSSLTAEFKSLDVSRMIGKPPSPRAYASLVETMKTKERGYMLLLHGGIGPNGTGYTDIHCALLSKEKIVWTTPYIHGSALIPRIKCTLQIAEDTDTLIIYGGASIDSSGTFHSSSTATDVSASGTPKRNGNRFTQQQTEKLGKLSAACRGSLSSENIPFDNYSDKYMGLPVTTVTLIDISKPCLESPPTSNSKDTLIPPSWSIIERSEPLINSLQQMIQWTRKSSLPADEDDSTNEKDMPSLSNVFPGYLQGALSVLVPPDTLRHGAVQQSLVTAVTKGLPADQWPTDVPGKVYNLASSALSCVVIARTNNRYHTKTETDEPTKKRINVPKVQTKASKSDIPSGATINFVTRPTGLFIVNIVPSLHYSALRSGLTMPVPLRGKERSTVLEPYQTGVKNLVPATKRSSSVYSYDDTELEHGSGYIAPPIDSRHPRSTVGTSAVTKASSLQPPPPPPLLHPTATTTAGSSATVVQKLVQRRGIQGPPPVPHAPAPTLITGGSLRGNNANSQSRRGQLTFTSTAPSNNILGIRVGQRRMDDVQSMFNEVLVDTRNVNPPPFRSTRSHAREVPLSQPSVLAHRSNTHHQPTAAVQRAPTAGRGTKRRYPSDGIQEDQEIEREEDNEETVVEKPRPKPRCTSASVSDESGDDTTKIKSKTKGKTVNPPKHPVGKQQPSHRRETNDTEEGEEDDNDIQELNDSTSYTARGRKGVTTASSSIVSPIRSERYTSRSAAVVKDRETKPVDIPSTKFPSSGGRSRRTTKSSVEPTVVTKEDEKQGYGNRPTVHKPAMEEEDEEITQELNNNLDRQHGTVRNARSSTGRKRTKLQASFSTNEGGKELSPIPHVTRQPSNVITRSQSRKGNTLDVSIFEPYTNNTASTMDENDELQGLSVLSPSKSVRKTRQSTFRVSDTKMVQSTANSNTANVHRGDDASTITIVSNKASTELLQALQELRDDVQRASIRGLSSSTSLRSEGSGRKGSASKTNVSTSVPLPVTTAVLEKLDTFSASVVKALETSLNSNGDPRTDTLAVNFTKHLSEVMKYIPIIREQIRSITTASEHDYENESTQLREEIDRLRKSMEKAEAAIEESVKKERTQQKKYEETIQKIETDKQTLSHEREELERRVKGLEEQYLLNRAHAETSQNELRRLRKMISIFVSENSNTNPTTNLGMMFDPHPQQSGNNQGRSMNTAFAYYPSSNHGGPSFTVANSNAGTNGSNVPWDVTATGTFPSSTAMNTSAIMNSTNPNTSNVTTHSTNRPPPVPLTSTTVNPSGNYHPFPQQPPLQPLMTTISNNQHYPHQQQQQQQQNYNSSRLPSAPAPIRESSVSVEAPDGLSHFTTSSVANIRQPPATYTHPNPVYNSHQPFTNNNSHHSTNGENNPPWDSDYYQQRTTHSKELDHMERNIIDQVLHYAGRKGNHNTTVSPPTSTTGFLFHRITDYLPVNTTHSHNPNNNNNNNNSSSGGGIALSMNNHHNNTGNSSNSTIPSTITSSTVTINVPPSVAVKDVPFPIGIIE